MKKFATLLLSLCMLAGIFAACGKDDGSTSQNSGSQSTTGGATENTNATDGPRQGGDFVRGTNQSIGEFFTPYKQGNLVEYGWPCYEPLAYRTSEGEWRGVLAEDWEVDYDSYTLTIKVRQGVSFHNGEAFSAEDVAFSLQSRQEYGTDSVIGSPSAIELVDEYTVQVVWDDFSLNFEFWILGQYMFSKATFEEKGLDWMLNNMVGTGPYMMEEYIPDVHLTFVRNPSYWGGREPGPDTMKWLYMPDETTQLAAFMNGEIDAFVTGTPSVVEQLQAAGYSGRESNVTSGLQYFAVPLTIKADDPLYSLEVRQAIFEHGIDWDNMALTLGGATGYHTDAVGLPQMTYYDETLERSSYDLDKALQMLADAGYPDGFSTTIVCSSMSDAPATVLQAELLKLGINAEVQTVDYTLIDGEYLAGKAVDKGIVITGLFYPSTNQTDRFTKHINYGATYGGSTDWTDEIKQIWDSLVTAKTEQEQDELLNQYVERLVHTDCTFWPMYNTMSLTFFQEWCHTSDIFASGAGGSDPFEIWLEEH